MMHWKTWTKISSVALFVIAVLGFYYANYYQKEAVLTIQNFPTAVDLDSLDTTEDITFTFFLYNEGEETAFVRSIIVLVYDEDQTQATFPVTISPRSDFTIAAKETKEITVALSAPGANARYTLAAEIFYDGTKAVSETVPVLWGGLY